MTEDNKNWTGVVPGWNAKAVTPNNDTVLPRTRALYIGTAGDVAVRMAGGEQVTFVGASGLLPVRVDKVLASGTDAEDIVAIY